MSNHEQGPLHREYYENKAMSFFFEKKGGKFSVAASLGLIFLWDPGCGVDKLQAYMISNDAEICGGGILGCGVATCGVKHEHTHAEPVVPLLLEYLQDSTDSAISIGAIMGVGLACAGSSNDAVLNNLSHILEDPQNDFDLIALSAISLGLIYVGSCREDVAQFIVSSVKDRSEAQLENEPIAKFVPLGLSLLYLGKQALLQEKARSVPDLYKNFSEGTRSFCDTILQSCMYAGSGDLVELGELIEQCKQDSGEHQGLAVLGIAVVSMTRDDVGLEKAISVLEGFLKHEKQNSRIKQAVPLSIGLLCISNPKVKAIDLLSTLVCDSDHVTAMAAIISLGLIGAGTKNAKIYTMLCTLSCEYKEHPTLLFCVRIAQGLVHLGKGLLTLAPHHSEEFLMSQRAMAGIIIFCYACLTNMESIFLGKYNYFLYFLVLAMQPKMLMFLNKDFESVSVPVTVGEADYLEQCGLSSITSGPGNILQTPVPLDAGQRAKLATDVYIPQTSVLEGFVLVKEKDTSRKK